MQAPSPANNLADATRQEKGGFYVIRVRGAPWTFVLGSDRSPVSDWQVPLSAVRLTEADIEAANEVYRSGWLSMGPRTQELESAFAEYTGAGHCLAVSSCTSGLHLAMLGAGLGPGDEAVVPSITFVASANAVAYTGARPVFAEIAAVDRPWLSAETAARAITPATKAIVAVSYGGHPGEIDGLRELASERDLALIEDAAHGSGSWLGDRHLGTFGLAGAISFSAGKNLGVGEGGMLLTDDAELAESARLMRWHGVTRSIWERHQASTESYDVAGLGFNYRLDDARAALARSCLRRQDRTSARNWAHPWTCPWAYPCRGRQPCAVLLNVPIMAQFARGQKPAPAPSLLLRSDGRQAGPG